MKKIVVFASLLLSIVTILFSFPSVGLTKLPEQQEAKNLVSSFKEIRYRLDAGSNYMKYHDYYSDLRVSVMKFKDSNGETPFDGEIENLLGLYKDINDFWQDGLSGPGYPSVNPQMAAVLRKYPGLENKVRWSSYGGRTYAYDVVQALFTYINSNEKILIDKIATQY